MTPWTIEVRPVPTAKNVMIFQRVSWSRSTIEGLRISDWEEPMNAKRRLGGVSTVYGPFRLRR